MPLYTICSYMSFYSSYLLLFPLSVTFRLAVFLFLDDFHNHKSSFSYAVSDFPLFEKKKRDKNLVWALKKKTISEAEENGNVVTKTKRNEFNCRTYISHIHPTRKWEWKWIKVPRKHVPLTPIFPHMLFQFIQIAFVDSKALRVCVHTRCGVLKGLS